MSTVRKKPSNLPKVGSCWIWDEGTIDECCVRITAVVWRSERWMIDSCLYDGTEQAWCSLEEWVDMVTPDVEEIPL